MRLLVLWVVAGWMLVGGLHGAPVVEVDQQFDDPTPLRQLEYYLDDRANAPFAQIQQRQSEGAFLNYPGGQLAPTDAAVWAHFRLKLIAPDRWFLHYNQAHIDRLDFYQLDQQEIIQQWNTGGYLSLDSRPILHPQYVFPLWPRSGANTDVFLRLQNDEAIQFPLYLTSQTHLAQTQITDRYLTWAYVMAAVLALAVYGFLGVFFRRPLYLYGFGFAAMILLMNLSLTGEALFYLWPDSLWWDKHSNPMFPALMMTFGVLFAREYLGVSRKSGWLNPLMLGFAGLSLSRSLLSLVGFSPLAVTLNFLFFPLFGALVLVAGVIRFRQGHQPARLFVAGWTGLALTSGVWALVGWGVIGWSTGPLYAWRLASVWEMGFMLAAQFGRFRWAQERLYVGVGASSYWFSKGYLRQILGAFGGVLLIGSGVGFGLTFLWEPSPVVEVRWTTGAASYRLEPGTPWLPVQGPGLLPASSEFKLDSGAPAGLLSLRYEGRQAVLLTGGSSLALEPRLDGALRFKLQGQAHFCLRRARSVVPRPVGINGFLLWTEGSCFYLHTLETGEGLYLSQGELSFGPEGPKAGPRQSIRQGSQGLEILSKPAPASLAASVVPGFEGLKAYAPIGLVRGGTEPYFLVRNGQRHQIQQAQLPIINGDRLISNATENLMLHLKSKDKIRIYPGGELAVEQVLLQTAPTPSVTASPAPALDLGYNLRFDFVGRLRAVISEKLSDRKIHFNSQASSIDSAKGTDFETMSQQDFSEVLVIGGAVGIADQKTGVAVAVTEGQMTSVEAGEPPKKPVAIPPGRMKQLLREAIPLERPACSPAQVPTDKKDQAQVRRFQKQLGLYPDGITGPETSRRIDQLLTCRAAQASP